MLASACFSRSKQEILPNVYDSSATSGPARFDIDISRGQGEVETLSVEVGNEHTVLRRVSVFDSAIARVHLAEETPLGFQPVGFDVFDEVVRVIDEIGMADFFVRNGVGAVAVHSGPNSSPRATSLQKLEAGELSVVFAVDIFNEGVDVPSIDTVLMLRPTESTIIWMQQLGRGLRKSSGKDRLTVIDYIGNHRAFLMKLRAIAALANQDAATSGRLREILDELVADRISLPAGCDVTYDLATIEILKQLLKPTSTESALEDFYRDFKERHGIRPTAVEAFHEVRDGNVGHCRMVAAFQFLPLAEDVIQMALPPGRVLAISQLERFGIIKHVLNSAA